jgi:hypothetical protein
MENRHLRGYLILAMERAGCTREQMLKALGELFVLLDAVGPDEAADKGAEILRRLRDGAPGV